MIIGPSSGFAFAVFNLSNNLSLIKAKSPLAAMFNSLSNCCGFFGKSNGTATKLKLAVFLRQSP